MRGVTSPPDPGPQAEQETEQNKGKPGPSLHGVPTGGRGEARLVWTPGPWAQGWSLVVRCGPGRCLAAGTGRCESQMRWVEWGLSGRFAHRGHASQPRRDGLSPASKAPTRSDHHKVQRIRDVMSARHTLLAPQQRGPVCSFRGQDSTRARGTGLTWERTHVCRQHTGGAGATVVECLGLKCPWSSRKVMAGGEWGTGVSGQQDRCQEGPWCQAPRMPVSAGPCAELGAGHGVRVQQTLRTLLGGLAVHQERQTHRHT